MSIGKICNREVVVINKDTSIVEAAKLMRQFHVGSLIVIEETHTGQKPIGIVTDRDLVIEVLAEEVAPETVSIQDIMTRNLVMVCEDDDILGVMEYIRSKGVRRIPVVNSIGMLVGILTVDDLLELFADSLSNLAKIVIKEQRQEAQARN